MKRVKVELRSWGFPVVLLPTIVVGRYFINLAWITVEMQIEWRVSR
ncbi:MAG TPA: hypothetical protein PKV35_01990 [bacterium]|nr:hypothetical protein [bacterium]